MRAEQGQMSCRCEAPHCKMWEAEQLLAVSVLTTAETVRGQSAFDDRHGIPVGCGLTEISSELAECQVTCAMRGAGIRSGGSREDLANALHAALANGGRGATALKGHCVELSP